MVSLSFLPLIIILPNKFSSLFSLGCICVFISLALLKGPEKFLKGLIQKDKIIYTVCYVLTLFGTLYFSIIKSAYLYTIIFSVL